MDCWTKERNFNSCTQHWPQLRTGCLRNSMPWTRPRGSWWASPALEVSGCDICRTEDGDGLLASRLALQLPLMRASKQTSEVAIGVVDVRGCGILANSWMSVASSSKICSKDLKGVDILHRPCQSLSHVQLFLVYHRMVLRILVFSIEFFSCWIATTVLELFCVKHVWHICCKNSKKTACGDTNSSLDIGTLYGIRFIHKWTPTWPIFVYFRIKNDHSLGSHMYLAYLGTLPSIVGQNPML